MVSLVGTRHGVSLPFNHFNNSSDKDIGYGDSRAISVAEYPPDQRIPPTNPIYEVIIKLGNFTPKIKTWGAI